MHRPRSARWLAAAPPLAVLLSLALVSSCHDKPTEPEATKQLTVDGVGSTAGGSIASDRGGIRCTVTLSGTVATTGTCSQRFPPGSVVTLTAAPASDNVLSGWQGCTATSDNRLTCHVTLDQDRAISAVFAPPASAFTLTVSGGAAGKGTVTSNVAGIDCTITDGTAGSMGCSASFPLNQQVTLTATASAGSYLKAWAGSGCDVGGTGVGGTGGGCVVLVNQTRSVVTSFDVDAVVASMGQWGSPIAWPAVAIHAHLLPNGTVLTWGAMDHDPVLWDPANPGSFGSALRPVDLFCSGHAFLPDGRLLVTGGHSGTDDMGIRSTVIYDFATNSWAFGPEMRNGRWYPTATTLANGEVLTVSGGDTAKALNVIPEVWQANGSWRVLSSVSLTLPYYPMMFVAPDGRVFDAGPDQSTRFLNTAGTGSFTPGPSSHDSTRAYGAAVMYDAGKILLVGGGEPTGTAEVIDLNAGAGAAWRPIASMSVARRQMNATLLADGTVLVTGGSNSPGFNTTPTDPDVLAAERWDPATEQWTTLGRMTHQRLYHSTALLLPDARVLSVCGGEPAAIGLTDDFTAEIFSPPYLFKADGTPATRPTITDAPISVAYGQTFTVQTPDAGSVAKVTWIRLSSVTHSFNQGQRMNSLAFSASGPSALSVTAPAGGSRAPPGHYMLFIVNGNGVPSVAKILRIF